MVSSALVGMAPSRRLCRPAYDHDDRVVATPRKVALAHAIGVHDEERVRRPDVRDLLDLSHLVAGDAVVRHEALRVRWPDDGSRDVAKTGVSDVGTIGVQLGDGDRGPASGSQAAMQAR